MNVLSPGNASAVTEGTQTPLGTSTTQMNVMQSLASAAPVRNNETDEDVDSNDNIQIENAILNKAKKLKLQSS